MAQPKALQSTSTCFAFSSNRLLHGEPSAGAGEGGGWAGQSLTPRFSMCAARPCSCPCNERSGSPGVAYTSFHSFIELDHLFPWDHSTLSSAQEDFVSFCVSSSSSPFPSPTPPSIYWLFWISPACPSSFLSLLFLYIFPSDFSENPMSCFSDFLFQFSPPMLKPSWRILVRKSFFITENFLHSQTISSLQLPVFVLSMRCLSNTTENTK